MAKDDTQRVQFTLPSALVEKIDALCERSSMTRTAFVVYTLAMAIDSYERVAASAGQALGQASAGDAG